ncbi:cytochrome b [Paraglaciecola sp. 2405UD69-4]|uniref:cytochrome b n=1 Tax=Paraglaciecola sp. 2405UD69-4 TaxID=3391836 RepID=UPI0039C9748D
MAYKNTAENYGVVAKWLHWATALLFLAAYASVYYREWFTESRTPENFSVLQIHFSIGISIAVVVFLRVYWRLTSITPSPEPGTKLEHLAAHAGHFALYAVMIIMPITGYIGTGSNTDFFFMFEIPSFKSTWLFEQVVANGLGMEFEAFEKPFDLIHKRILGPWLAWMLIVGHAGAAFYHHFVKKDRTLLKMTSGK